MTRKAMASKEDHYLVLVDNRVSVENVTRFAEHQGYKVTVTEKDGDFTLDISR
jgi:TusA-related sulfurtransferase